MAEVVPAAAARVWAGVAAEARVAAGVAETGAGQVAEVVEAEAEAAAAEAAAAEVEVEVEVEAGDTHRTLTTLLEAIRGKQGPTAVKTRGAGSGTVRMITVADAWFVSQLPWKSADKPHVKRMRLSAGYSNKLRRTVCV